MASGEKKPARARVVLTDISSRAWEHPADKGALVALRRLKGFDVLLKTMSGVFRERAWRLRPCPYRHRIRTRCSALSERGRNAAAPARRTAVAPAKANVKEPVAATIHPVTRGDTTPPRLPMAF